MASQNVVDEVCVRRPAKQPVPIELLLEDTARLVSGDPQFADIDLTVSGADVTVPCDVPMLKPVKSSDS
jgi:hypothetical protein